MMTKFYSPKHKTDLWEIYYVSSPQTAPVRAVGEHELGWYMMVLTMIILQRVAAQSVGTQTSWIVDWFEVNDDEEDGLRGDSSPIRYDSRQTG